MQATSGVATEAWDQVPITRSKSLGTWWARGRRGSGWAAVRRSSCSPVRAARERERWRWALCDYVSAKRPRRT